LVDLQAEFNALKISGSNNKDEDVEMEEGVGLSDDWRLDQYYN
jgi:hypothetical protein